MNRAERRIHKRIGVEEAIILRNEPDALLSLINDLLHLVLTLQACQYLLVGTY